MFELSKEHEDFRRVVREFALAEVAPHAAEWDAQHRFPVELVPRMGDLGLFGLVVPEEFGGAGGDFTSLCVAIEELGRVDQSVGITLSAGVGLDRKSTRLNSSHVKISYAVFCLKKKKENKNQRQTHANLKL